MQQEKFSSQGRLKGSYLTLGKEKVVLSPHFSNNLHQKNNNFCPQLTVVFVRHQQLASLQKETELVTSVLCFFVEEVKGNNI
jgi:hypothetical protein